MLSLNEITCEICGKPVIRKKYYRFQGTILILCERCASVVHAEEYVLQKFVGVKRETQRAKIAQRKSAALKFPEELSFELVSNFGEIIRKARERKKIEREKLARMIGISDSVLGKIESGRLKPDIYTARRIESILKIRILRKIDLDLLESVSGVGEKIQPLTLGDILVIEKPKKKKKVR